MRRTLGIFFLMIIHWMTVSEIGFCQSQSTRLKRIQPGLLSPEEDSKLISNTVHFLWKMRASETPLRVNRYELMITAKRKGFIVSRTIPSAAIVASDTTSTISYLWFDFKKDVPRHGRYFWFVDAVDSAGNHYRSDVQSFIVAAYPIKENLVTEYFPYSLRFGYNHRVKTPDYYSLIRNAEPRIHLRSFSELGFSLRQDSVLWSKLHFQETFLIFSHGGIGAEASSKFRMLQTLYFSLYPYVGTTVGWYATGLKSYSSKAYDCSLGCELVVLPKGYFTLFSEWIPIFRIHYLEKENGLITFDGKGWDAGVRVILPSNVINRIKFLGLTINLERIQLEFHFSRFHDAYTDNGLDVRKIILNYFLQ